MQTIEEWKSSRALYCSELGNVPLQDSLMQRARAVLGRSASALNLRDSILERSLRLLPQQLPRQRACRNAPQPSSKGHALSERSGPPP
mmetsp:Transcript_46374/g.96570  ORF Transcript_46374/g.96570 Transcript_46374/m.96570 type:complete len:88 (-) Transcript_46374:635-898(-)